MSTPTALDPTQLADVGLAAASLFALDDDRAVAGTDYSVDLQGAVHGYDGAHTDAAPRPLFRVAPELLRRPLYAAYVALLDNYNAQTGVSETSTPQQAAEEDAFLTQVMATRPMRYVHALLTAKRLAPPGQAEWKAALHQQWFRKYTRAARDDTCGFEHTFCGEVAAGEDGGKKIIGLHNWITVALEEKAGRLNYYGHVPPKKSTSTPSDALLSVQFAWRGAAKDISSMFVGTSPALEVALYTLLHCAGCEETRINVNGLAATVRVYTIRSKYGNKVGSAFPVLNGRAAGPAPPTPYGGSSGRVTGGRPQRPAGGGEGKQPSCGDIIVELIKLVVRLLK